MEKIKFLIIPVMFIYFLVQNDNFPPLSLVFLPIREEVFKLWGLVMGKRREGV